MVNFWDTSAIVPLLVNEDVSAHQERLLKQFPEMIVAFTTSCECYSALCRLKRDNLIDEVGFRSASKKLEMLSLSWEVVSNTPVLEEETRRVLRIHPLKCADAFQLASALLVSLHEPRTTNFISLDDRLIECAQKEGFMIVGQ